MELQQKYEITGLGSFTTQTKGNEKKMVAKISLFKICYASGSKRIDTHTYRGKNWTCYNKITT